MRSLLVVQPKERLSAEEALRHPWLAEASTAAAAAAAQRPHLQLTATQRRLQSFRRNGSAELAA